MGNRKSKLAKVDQRNVIDSRVVLGIERATVSTGDATMQSSWTWVKNHDIISRLDDGQRVVQEIIHALRRHEWKQDDVFAVHLVLEEAVVNAIRHGNGLDPSKRVRVETKISAQRCWIQVEDEGSGFDPREVPDCTANENLEKPGGRGLMLMQNFMSSVEYNEAGNRVVMEKVLD